MNQSVLITGVAASGKSAVCDELNRLGYTAYDIEAIKGLFKLVDAKTGEQIEKNNNENLALVQQSLWICDKDKLKEMILVNKSRTTYFCGVSSNISDIVQLLDKVFILVVNDDIIRDRLSSRTSNDYGRTKEVQDWILSWKGDFDDHLVRAGAIAIDANQNISQVAAEIIDKT